MFHTAVAIRLHSKLKRKLRLNDTKCRLTHRGTYSIVSIPGMDIEMKGTGSCLFTPTGEKTFFEVDLLGILAAVQEARP